MTAAALAALLLAAAVATTAVLAPRPAQAQTMPTPSVCDRTQQIRDAIVAAIDGITNCTDVTSAHLTGIQELDASETGLTALLAGDFNGMTGLRSLLLTFNQLTSLPAGIFDSLTGLRSLDLYNNQLTSLPAGIFDSLTELRSLDLYNNQLTSLPAGDLRQLDEIATFMDVEQSYPATSRECLQSINFDRADLHRY